MGQIVYRDCERGEVRLFPNTSHEHRCSLRGAVGAIKGSSGQPGYNTWGTWVSPLYSHKISQPGGVVPRTDVALRVLTEGCPSCTLS